MTKHHISISKMRGKCFQTLLLGVTLLAAFMATDVEVRAVPEPEKSNHLIMNDEYGRLPMHFEPNLGQCTEAVEFFARGRGYALFLTGSEAVLSLRQVVPDEDLKGRQMAVTDAPPRSAVVRMQFFGAAEKPVVKGEELKSGRSNYLTGNDTKCWRTGVPHYGRVRYKNLYPGIDLVFYGNPGQLEYDFVLAPGANPAQVKLKITGADQIRLDETGNLVLKVAGGEVIQRPPKFYQELNGNRQVVSGGYVLSHPARAQLEQAASRTWSLGFQVAGYDPLRPLIIDPVLVYSTYVGGTGFDYGTSIAVDEAGNAYVTGYADSSDFPTVDPLIGSHSGNSDAFIAKLDTSGTALVFSTYLGGTGSDYGNSIAVDEAGNAYVTGYTDSSDFPTVDPLDGSHSGNADAFIAKLDASGSALVFSTYLGGSSDDYGLGIAVDGDRNTYVTGYTESNDFLTADSLDGSHSGNSDAFIAKLDASGSALVFSTYLGGSSDDYGSNIAVDGAGNAYITGDTISGDFPTVDPLYNSSSGGYDAFIAKLDASGSALVFSTYLGGGSGDFGTGIAVDGDRNVYVTGFTSSGDFPTVEPLYNSNSGGYDAFIAKLDASGSALVFSTYLGGSSDDFSSNIALDGDRNAYVTGATDSSDFPTVNPLNGSHVRFREAFITKLDANGSALVFSTPLGGGSSEFGLGIAVDGDRKAYVTGATDSSDFPAVNPLYNNNAGSNDAFITKISHATAASTIYVSTSSGGQAGGVPFSAEDILVHNLDTGTWEIYFDGSDVGLSGADVDAFYRMEDGSLLLSLKKEHYIAGSGWVDDSDIIRFYPGSLGPATTGSFEWYFDGSDVGLQESSEDLDSIGFAPDGRLVVSTSGSFRVSGVRGRDEDLIVFAADSLGSDTRGVWEMYFDGSDVGLTGSTEDVWGIWIDGVDGVIHLTVQGLFSIAALTGDGADIFRFDPISLGAGTQGGFSLFWKGSAEGLAGEVIDALAVGQ